MIGITIGFALNLLAGVIISANSMHVVNGGSSGEPPIAISNSPLSVPIILSQSHRACVPINFETWTVASWFLMLCFEFSLFLLAAYEGVRYVRETRVTRELDIATRARWTKERSLIYILMRDSIIFPLM